MHDNYVWMICRITDDPCMPNIEKDYYFEEDSWSPMHIANRYTQDQTYLVLQILHRLYDESTSKHTRYAPCKVSKELIASWENQV